MKEKDVDQAIKYASSSNKIENLNLEKSELEQIKEAIISKKEQDSFLYSIVKNVKEEKINDKTK